MSILILQSVLLLFAAFMVSAGLGWLLAGRAMSEHSAFEKRPRTVFFENTDVVSEVATAAVHEPVSVIKPQLEASSALSDVAALVS
eukprot:gene21660-27550_t